MSIRNVAMVNLIRLGGMPLVLLVTLAVAAACTTPVRAEEGAKKRPASAKKDSSLPYRKLTDLQYASPDKIPLKLDLYLPLEGKDWPLVMYIHGGSWRAGSKKGCPIHWLTEKGFAVASIDYRLSQQAVFPAQIVDCKGAVRWLRAHASEYGYSAGAMGVAGSSAGGHLAALLATSGGVKELEGDVGGNLDQSSAVQAVVDYYGASDFILRSKTQPKNTDDPKGNVYQLLGGAVGDNPELAKLASSVTHVDESDPPLLIIHGLMDKSVEPVQGIRLFQVYSQNKLPVDIAFVKTGAHGGKEFYAGEYRQLVIDFFDEYLKAKPASADSSAK